MLEIRSLFEKFLPFTTVREFTQDLPTAANVAILCVLSKTNIDYIEWSLHAFFYSLSLAMSKLQFYLISSEAHFAR